MMKVLIKSYFFAFVLGLTFMPTPIVTGAAIDQNFLAEVQRFKALKEEDPEAFHNIISKKKAGLKKNFQRLREEDPERFQAFLDKRKQFKRKHMKQFKEKHPQDFNVFMNRKRKRMEHLRDKNPERFEQWMNNHPKWRDQFQHRRKREGRENLYKGTSPRFKKPTGQVRKPASGKFRSGEGPRQNRVGSDRKPRKSRGPLPAGQDVRR